MSKELSGVKVLQIIQKLFGASAIGLGSYTVYFYNSALYNSDPYNPAYAQSSDEKIALFGAGFCIFSVTTPLAPTTVSILSNPAIGSVLYSASLYPEGSRRWLHGIYLGSLLRTHGCREWTRCEWSRWYSMRSKLLQLRTSCFHSSMEDWRCCFGCCWAAMVSL